MPFGRVEGSRQALGWSDFLLPGGLEVARWLPPGGLEVILGALGRVLVPLWWPFGGSKWVFRLYLIKVQLKLIFLSPLDACWCCLGGGLGGFWECILEVPGGSNWAVQLYLI